MSQRDLQRYHVISKAVEGRMSISEAATALSLTHFPQLEKEIQKMTDECWARVRKLANLRKPSV